MVSFKGGKFILPRRDGRLHSISRRRRSTCRRALLISLAFSLFYAVHRRNSLRSDPDDLALLRTARDADVKSSLVETSKDNNDSNGDGADDEVRSTAATAGSNDNKQSLLKDKDGERNECSVSLSEKFLDYLKTLEPIPKKVHMFFPDKDYWREDPPLNFVNHSILALKELNPDWNVTVYDDQMVDDVIRRGADSNIIAKEEADVLVGLKDDDGKVIQDTAAHIVERSDIVRLLLMYMEGGIYLDVDRLISKRIEDVIHPNTRLCLPTYGESNFCQDLMCTAPRNDLFLSMIREATTIRLRSERRRGWARGGSLFDLGPPLYNKQIFVHVFGADEGMYDKCKEHMYIPRKLIEGLDGVIVTKLEKGCNDGFLVDKTSLPICYQRSELYDKYKMVHWATEVNERWKQ